MARRLRALKIREISAVDRGAGEGVRIVLTKRDESALTPKQIAKQAALEAYAKRNVVTEAEAAEKREFSAEERRTRASNGHAMGDGSFPIDNGGDLKNAIRLAGNAKNPAKARRHIMSRARALGLSDRIPDTWKGGTQKRLKGMRKAMKRFVAALSVDKALDFNAAQAANEAREYADGMICEVREAVCALQTSICDIMNDPAVANKQTALETTFKQFHEHLGGIVPEGVEQALQAAQLIASGAMVNAQGALIKGADMDANEKAAFDELETKLKSHKERRKAAETESEKVGKQLKRAEKTLGSTTARLDALLAMPADQRAWFNHPDHAMSKDDRVAFLDMKTEKRAEFVKENPVESLTEKRLDSLPEDVRKQLAEDAAFRKRSEEREAADELKVLTKRASELGLPADVGKHLVALRKSAPEAADATLAEIEKVFARITKSAEAQANLATVIKEYGGAGDGDAGSAITEMAKRAEEIMKADDKLSYEGAVAKVASSKLPSDRELWPRYKDELAAQKAA